MDIRILNPLDFPDWDNMIAPLSGSSFFHTSAWARVLSETYGYKPTYFTIFEGDRLTSLLPVMDVKSILTGHRGVSLPFTDFCEPIIDDNLKFHDILKQIVAHGKKSGWKYIEIRGGQKHLSGVTPSAEVWGHTLNLSNDSEKIFSSLKNNTKRNIKKAIREGVDVKILNSDDSVKDFYKLNCMTRKHHGLPPQPYLFFRNIYEHVIAKNSGFISLALFQGKPIAGNMYFHFGKKAIYKYGASDQRYQDRRANNLVMWEAIKWYCVKGFKELHFGRTEFKHLGLKQFKMGWGVQEHTIDYFKYNLVKDTFISRKKKIMSLQENIFRNIPIPLLKIFGTLLYGHMA